MLDVLLQKLILKSHVLDCAPGDIVEGENADEHPVIDYWHMGDV